MKKESGITLIALIVTIIVILLLAGISIVMLTGDNGILNNASSAKNKSDVAELKEIAQLVITGRVTDKNLTGIVGNLKDDLEEAFSDAEVENALGASDVCYVSKNNAEITVYENGEIVEGKVSVWKGTQNEVTDIASPEFKMGSKDVFDWYISTGGQLKFLADFVNNGNKFDGRDDLKNLVEAAGYNKNDITMTTDTMIYLMNNIDLGARQTNGTLTSGTAWTPIGIDDNYVYEKLGTFEGNNHTISGVYVCRITEEEYAFNGIFGCSNSIKNLTVQNSYIRGETDTGGIVGYFIEGEIENCHNKNTEVRSERFVGGIAGYSDPYTVIKKSSNSGSITVTNYDAGGIAGDADYVEECINTGTIRQTAQASSNGYIGGIVGMGQIGCKIKKCVNTGLIDSAYNYTGGIIGICPTDNDDPSEEEPSLISECYNTGKVKGRQVTGGITGGLAQYNSLIEKSYNLGEVEGTDKNTGGLVGQLGRSSKMHNCYNMKQVKGTKRVGGLIGYTYYSKCEIKNCYNAGAVIGTSKLGGIISSNENAADVINSYYLDGTASLDFGNETTSDLKKDKTFITTTFVSTANSSETIWQVNANENDGWPVLCK